MTWLLMHLLHKSVGHLVTVTTSTLAVVWSSIGGKVILHAGMRRHLITNALRMPDSMSGANQAVQSCIWIRNWGSVGKLYMLDKPSPPFACQYVLE